MVLNRKSAFSVYAAEPKVENTSSRNQQHEAKNNKQKFQQAPVMKRQLKMCRYCYIF